LNTAEPQSHNAVERGEFVSVSNRRRNRRIKAKGVFARLHTTEGSWLCMVANLSLGGAYIRSSKPLPPGTAVTIELSGGGFRGAVRVKGRVANILDLPKASAAGMLAGMGIGFDAMTEFDAEQLRRLLPSLNGSTPSVALEKDGDRAAPPGVQPLASSSAVDPGAADQDLFRIPRSEAATLARADASAAAAAQRPTLLGRPPSIATALILPPPPLEEPPASPSRPLPPPAGDSATASERFVELVARVRAGEAEIARLREENERLRAELRSAQESPLRSADRD
jgi:hypothetical protein